MNTTPNLVEVEKILKRLLPKDYGAVLFGSRAKGRAKNFAVNVFRKICEGDGEEWRRQRR
jgi:predicted nucleotidyltransferase